LTYRCLEAVAESDVGAADLEHVVF
jgi:hypothetical protein